METHLMRDELKMLCPMAATDLVFSNIFSLLGRISVKALMLSKAEVLHSEKDGAYFP